MGRNCPGVPMACPLPSPPLARGSPGTALRKRSARAGWPSVFRAVDERLDRPVALKILAPALAANEEFRQPVPPRVAGRGRGG